MKKVTNILMVVGAAGLLYLGAGLFSSEPRSEWDQCIADVGAGFIEAGHSFTEALDMAPKHCASLGFKR